HVLHFLDNPSPDGGEWNMVVNIIDKYGLIPRELMPDTFNRVNSRYMNFIANSKLREGAALIRKMHKKGKPLTALRKVKTEFMEEIYRILAITLGEPPLAFNWAYKKEGKGKKKGKKAKDDGFIRMTGVSPREFYKRACDVPPGDINVLVSSPMKNMPYNRTYTVQFFNNMVGGQNQVSLNLPIDELKKLAIRILQAGDACLFGCEVRLDMHSKEGILDTELFGYDLVFNTDFKLNKAERLEYRQAITSSRSSRTRSTCRKSSATSSRSNRRSCPPGIPSASGLSRNPLG
ncbi:MAG: C1 family peptidase, partial [Planctomycetota bacterium]